MQNIHAHAFRLHPGQDLKKGIQDFVNQQQITAGWISTAVGSLTKYHIRFANQSNGVKGAGYFEIISITGTVSINGSHLHMSIANETGHTIGGHLLDGNEVYTTAEMVILSTGKYIFRRSMDESTSFPELIIEDV